MRFTDSLFPVVAPVPVCLALLARLPPPILTRPTANGGESHLISPFPRRNHPVLSSLIFARSGVDIIPSHKSPFSLAPTLVTNTPHANANAPRRLHGRHDPQRFTICPAHDLASPSSPFSQSTQPETKQPPPDSSPPPYIFPTASSARAVPRPCLPAQDKLCARLRQTIRVDTYTTSRIHALHRLPNLETSRRHADNCSCRTSA